MKSKGDADSHRIEVPIGIDPARILDAFLSKLPLKKRRSGAVTLNDDLRGPRYFCRFIVRMNGSVVGGDVPADLAQKLARNILACGTQRLGKSTDPLRCYSK